MFVGVRQAMAVCHALPVLEGPLHHQYQHRLATCARRIAVSTLATARDSESSAQSASDFDDSSSGIQKKDARKRLKKTSSAHKSTHAARLKPSNKLRTHPSKEREKAWQINHDRKTRSWEASTTSVEASIMDQPEQYFDEKWVHRQGRLSDFTGSVEEDNHHNSQLGRRHSKRHRASHRPPHIEAEARPSQEPQTDANSLPFQDAAVSQAAGPGWRFFATCHPGLEQAVVKELNGPMVRAQDVRPGQSGVTFWGQSIETGYRACLWLRCAIRVLVLLASGPMDCSRPSGDVLYEWTRESVDWPGLLQRGQSFSVDARTRNCSTVPSSQLARVRIRDAIADSVRDSRGEKLWPPEQDTIADIPLCASLYNNHIELYRDMSGISLHRRGYRSAMHAASLNESAAAGLLTLAGWPKQQAVLADPMCGSGTFLIEAALMVRQKAPGLDRKVWPFNSWIDQDRRAWDTSLEEAKDTQADALDLETHLLGNDIHEGALSLAQRDARSAGVCEMIDFSHGPCKLWKPSIKPKLVITNPPWGLRLKEVSSTSKQRFEEGDKSLYGDQGDGSEVLQSWKDLGTFLKTQCRDSDAYVLTGDMKPSTKLGLKPSKRFAVGIGGVDCKFLHYDILPPRTW